MAGQSAGGFGFPTTHWSLIGRAGDGHDRLRSDALDQLLRRYWPALKTHLIVKKRIPPNDADDLVQGFIQEKVLERNLCAAADAARGRFRTLLATALDNYVVNQWERRSAKKRAAERAATLDDEARQHWAAEYDSPEHALDVAWARQVLDEALHRMKAECDASGRPDLWGAFEQRLLLPILEAAEPISYEELVTRFNYASPTQASNALITAKRMFARNVKSVVAEYAMDESEVEAEIGELHTILSKGRGHV